MDIGHHHAKLSSALLAAILVSACGGGASDTSASQNAAAQASSQTVTLLLDGTALSSDAAAVVAQPMFHAAAALAPMATTAVTPMASSSDASTYTPAQIRAAYGLPALPTVGSTLTPTQAAQMGAGQTIYIIATMHDPNIAAELNAFNQKFDLPACTTTTISATARLPLATATSSGCEFSVVYNTSSGTMTSGTPAYDAAWATEMALDVQ